MAGSVQKSGLGSRAFSAGLTMAASVALFAYGGYLLDGWLDIKPLFFVIGTLLGILGGTVHLLLAVAPETLPFGRRKKKKLSDGDSKPRNPADPEPRSRDDDPEDR